MPKALCSQNALLLLIAGLVVGCVTSGNGGTDPPAIEPSPITRAAARPISERADGVEPTPALLQTGAGRVRPIGLEAHQIETAPATAQQAPTRSSAASASALGGSIRATDVPGPAGPARPGSRGIGAPWAPGPAVDSPDNPSGGPGILISGGDPQPLAPPTLGTSFDSTNMDTSGPLTGLRFIPPDAHAAAGPGHVVAVTNVTVQIHDKAGMSICTIALADFFASQSPATELFDPKILYDQFSDRWLLVALEQTTAPDTSKIMVAVSNDADPDDPGMACGTWYQFSIDGKVTVGADHWTDFPGFAVDEEAIYITGNLFRFVGGAFGGVRLWIIDKVGGAGGGFYGGGTATHSSPLDPYTCLDCFETTTQPAQIFGIAPKIPNVGTYLVSYSGLTDGSDEYLQIVRVDDPLPLASPPTFTQEFVNIGELEDFLTGLPLGALPDAPQMGTSQLIEANDRRAQSAVWRNHKLYVAADIEPITGPDAGQTTAHWWILDTTTPSNGVDPPETLLGDQGSIDGEDIAVGTTTFFPSIAVNDAEEVAIGFSASSPTIFAGSYYTTRKPDDAASTNSGSGLLRAGLAAYHRDFGGAENRWGDYSGAALDPADQCFWVYNQHAIVTEVPITPPVSGCNPPVDPIAECGRWGTAFGKLCLDCASSPIVLSTATSTVVTHRGPEITVQGGGDVEAFGDLTLQGQTIAIEDGFTAEGDLSIFTGFCPPLAP